MLLEPGDIVTSRGDYAMFQIQFNEESPYWWPCHLAYGEIWLVLDINCEPMSDVLVAKLLSLTALDSKPWWVEGNVEQWCTLDKVN